MIGETFAVHISLTLSEASNIARTLLLPGTNGREIPSAYAAVSWSGRMGEMAFMDAVSCRAVP